MALTNQFTGITGRRLNRSLVPIINQQTQYLPSIYARRDEQADRDRMYGLARQGLKNEKEQAKTAKLLGYAGLGVQGLSGLGSLYNATQAAEEPVSQIASQGINQAWQSPLTDQLESMSGSAPEIPSSGLSDLTNLIPSPIKNVASSLWDFGSSLYDNTIGSMFEGLFS